MKLGSSIRRRRGSGGPAALVRKLLPTRNEEQEEPQKKSRWRAFCARWGAFLKDPWTLGVLGFLCAAGFAGGYLFSTRVVYPLPPPPGDLAQVPNLAGANPEDAADSLRVLGLVLGPVDSLNHPTIPEGRIVGQSPLPGQLSLVGDTVRIALSAGPEQRPVPDVLRLHADRARTVLETSGFVVTVDSVRSDDPRGGVVAMSPEPGTEATIPMEVHLSVSRGPPEFEMPLLLGMSEEDARLLLDSLGLVIREVETRFRFGRDQGLVVDQTPPARARVQEGASVRLVVGRRGEYSGEAKPGVPSQESVGI
jgi:serine/threonine-protein kinase